MSKQLRFGIIGCGVIAPNHIKAINLSKDLAVVGALCDIELEKAEKMKKEFNLDCKIYQDYKEMIKDPDIDIISVCTPSGMHGEMAVDVARAGKHVLCEKPMEITKEKLDWMVEELEKCDVKVGCIFQRRTSPVSIAVKNAINSGKFGKVILADAYLKYYRSPGYYKSAGWRATWELDGGGALMNQGVHGIDLLSWLVGDVESLFARVDTKVHDINVEDTAIVSLKFKNGAFGNIEGTTSVYPAQETRFEIHMEKGTIIFSDSGILTWSHVSDLDEKAPKIETSVLLGVEADPKISDRASHVWLVRDICNAVNENRKPLVTPREARGAVDMILAIYQSSSEHREISL